ncbi:hypothetical protein FVE85_6525 [Porphyridium purpureum]|uniref:Uncharacterized protein n=1 Tax=Porphyridium purpureum TaxID=35688 RepID=A0A5J4Z704_PORPP|nr:hypothetical protein FVE85_6525 [Porphyridium purpureum]|eukprot:POR9295..scf295_1
MTTERKPFRTLRAGAEQLPATATEQNARRGGTPASVVLLAFVCALVLCVGVLAFSVGEEQVNARALRKMQTSLAFLFSSAQEKTYSAQHVVPNTFAAAINGPGPGSGEKNVLPNSTQPTASGAPATAAPPQTQTQTQNATEHPLYFQWRVPRDLHEMDGAQLARIFASLNIQPDQLPRRKNIVGIECLDTTNPRDLPATQILRSYYYLFDGLKNAYGWKFATRVQFMDDALFNRTFGVPDVLVVCVPIVQHKHALVHAYEYKRAHPGTKLALFNDDLHTFKLYMSPRMIKDFFDAFDVYMGPYVYRLWDYLATLPSPPSPNSVELVWIPHAAAPEYLHYYTFNKYAMRAASLPGRINDEYPLRDWLHTNLRQLGVVVRIDHPGYIGNYTSTTAMQFAESIRPYVAMLADTRDTFFLVSKIYEAMAVGVLAMPNSDTVDLLAGHGIINGTHFLAYDSISPGEMIAFVTNPENAKYIDSIRANGMQVVLQAHTIMHRAWAMHAYFELGTHVHRVPKSFKRDLCPNVVFPDHDKCMENFLKTSRYSPLVQD